MTLEPTPVLLYHSVQQDPSSWICAFTVSPATLARHLGLLVASGRTPVTVSQLRDGLAGRRGLPERPVVVTIDDGFADTLTAAAPILRQHAVCSTVYVTTGFVTGTSPGGDRMLDWSQVAELRAQGHEIGAHSVTHPQLDTLTRRAAWHEIRDGKNILEDRLGEQVRTFAYPHGYSSPVVRRLTRQAGFESACSVKNALSFPADPQLAVSRLMLTARTSDETVRRWLDGAGAPVGRRDERLITRAWRGYRRIRAGMAAARRHP